MIPDRLRGFVQGVSVNPAEHDWAADNVVSGAEAARLRERLDAWCGMAAGGDGEVIEPQQMDAEQRFAYRIHEAKIDEREKLERRGGWRSSARCGCC